MATPRTKQGLLDEWGQRDPFDYNADLLISLGGRRWSSVTAVTFASATQTLITVPANSIILDRKVVRTTAWNAITTFEIGKDGDTDWLMTTAQADLTAAIGAGEDGEVQTNSGRKVVTSDTSVLLTIDQGAASAGAGFVIVDYQELT